MKRSNSTNLPMSSQNFSKKDAEHPAADATVKSRLLSACTPARRRSAACRSQRHTHDNPTRFSAELERCCVRKHVVSRARAERHVVEPRSAFVLYLGLATSSYPEALFQQPTIRLLPGGGLLSYVLDISPTSSECGYGHRRRNDLGFPRCRLRIRLGRLKRTA